MTVIEFAMLSAVCIFIIIVQAIHLHRKEKKITELKNRISLLEGVLRYDYSKIRGYKR